MSKHIVNMFKQKRFVDKWSPNEVDRHENIFAMPNGQKHIPVIKNLINDQINKIKELSYVYVEVFYVLVRVICSFNNQRILVKTRRCVFWN